MDQETMSRKSAAAASTALSIAEFIDNYPGLPEGARAAMLLLKLDIISFLNYAWREVHNKMLLRRSIALDCLERTLPPIDEDQKLALLHAPFKGTTLFGGELAKLQEANTKRAATFTVFPQPTVIFEGIKTKVINNEGVLPPQVSPVGGRLSNFVEEWKRITNDPYVLSIVAKGYRLRFTSPPLLRQTPWEIRSPQDPQEILGMWEQITLMLQKNEITEVPPDSPGFYSNVFLVRKASGGWRPVIDLKNLNAHIHAPHFRMFRTSSVLSSVEKGDYAFKIDLQDAYFHVPIHPSSRKYLRFAFENRVYQFEVLPFGLNTAPQVFTRLGHTVTAYLHRQGVSVIPYLDDWLVHHPDRQILLRHQALLIDTLDLVGFILNRKKSELDLTQDLQFLGIHLRLDLGRSLLPESKAGEIVACARHLSSLKVLNYSQVSHLMGSLNWASGLIPLGRLYLRPLQRHFHSLGLTNQFTPPSKSDPVVLANLLPQWLDPHFLTSGIPIRPFQADYTIFMDASIQGWGAHMGDSKISGTWTRIDRKLHISCLELKAVTCALQHWAPLLQGHQVMVATDNSTVVSYINKQGGTHSTSLLRLTVELFLWLRVTRHNSPGKTHSRLPERDSRPPISSESANTDRVVPTPRDHQTHLQVLGDTRSRHVCDTVELPPSSVHVSSPGATSPSGGCSVSRLAGEVNVHVSTFSPAQQGRAEITVHSIGRVDPRSPLVTVSTVVPTPTTSLCGTPVVSPIPSRSSVSAGPEVHLRRKVVPSARREALMRHYKAAGFSDEVSRLAAAPRRPSTNRMYDDRWRRFTRWAAGQGFDPLDPTAAQIASFLFDLFDTHGLSPQTIKGYRTCIGSVLNRTGRAKVVLHRTISDMIASMELQRPRTTPVLPQWDLGVVLEALSNSPYEPLREASFKHLTLKMVFLLAMASAGRPRKAQ